SNSEITLLTLSLCLPRRRAASVSFSASLSQTSDQRSFMMIAAEKAMFKSSLKKLKSTEEQDQEFTGRSIVAARWLQSATCHPPRSKIKRHWDLGHKLLVR